MTNSPSAAANPRKENKENMNLTKPEFMLIVDSTNGLALIESMSTKDQIVLNVADSIDIERLDEKWSVDKTVLEGKLANATEEEHKQLWANIREFWARNDRENHA